MNIKYLVLGLMITASPVLADSIVTDRPDFTESTGVVQKLQIEAGFTRSEKSPNSPNTSHGEVLIRIPLNSKVEGRIGLEDNSIGLKYKLADNMAFIAATGPEPVVKFCMSHPLSDQFLLSSNLNYAQPAGDSELSASLSLGITLTEQLGTYLEAYGFQRGSNSVVNAGATYLVSDDLQLDVRAGQGLNGLSKDYFVGAGVSSRFDF